MCSVKLDNRVANQTAKVAKYIAERYVAQVQINDGVIDLEQDEQDLTGNVSNERLGMVIELLNYS